MESTLWCRGKGTSTNQHSRQLTDYYVAISICGDYSPKFHDIMKELSGLDTGMCLEDASCEEEGAQIARRVGQPRRELSVALHRALSFRTLRYVREKTIRRLCRTQEESQAIDKVGDENIRERNLDSLCDS